MKTFWVVVAACLLLQCSQKSSQSGVVGKWSVDLGKQGKYILTLADDSTLTENVFGKSGRWKLEEGDSTQKSPARLTLLNDADEGYSYDLIKESDSTMELGQSDWRITLTRFEGDDPQPVDPFVKYMLLFNGPRKHLVPAPLAITQELNKAFNPEEVSLLPGQALIFSDTLFAGTLVDNMSATAVVFDVQKKQRLEYQEIFRGELCSVGYTVLSDRGQPIIKQIVSCGDEEGVEPSRDITLFLVDKSGKLLKTVDKSSKSGAALDNLVVRLMSTVYQMDFHKDSKEGNTLVFSGNDYEVRGSYKMLGDFANVSVAESGDMASSSKSGLFKFENDVWVSQFPTELIPGIVDTLVDLNNDGQQEIMIDAFTSNSAGANHTYILYAKQHGNLYERIDTVATSSDGYTIYQFSETNHQIVSTIQYVMSGDKIIIQVKEDHQWTIDPSTKKFGSEKVIFTYSWDGSQLTAVQKKGT